MLLGDDATPNLLASTNVKYGEKKQKKVVVYMCHYSLSLVNDDIVPPNLDMLTKRL